MRRTRSLPLGSKPAKGRRWRIDRAGGTARDPPLASLEDRLLGAERRDEAADTSGSEDTVGDRGLVDRVISFFGGGGGPSPFEPESADPLSAAVSDASATAKEAQHSLDPLAMFPGMGHAGADVAASEAYGSEEEDSEGEEEDEVTHRIYLWLQSKLLNVLLTLGSLAIIGLSIFVQVMPWSYATIGKNAVYVRWACFAGTLVPVYYTMRKLLSRLFVLIELRLFRDSLAYLSNLKEASVNVVFAYVELAVFYIIFHVAFCFGKFEKTCEDPVYVARSVVGMKCLLCLGLFLTASWLACLASKMLSTHFYKSTHFKKFREALNREYVLHALSMPKRKVIQLHNSQMGMSEAAAASEVLRDGGGFSGTLPGYASPHGMSRPNKPGAAPSSAVAIGMNGAAGQRGEEGRESAAASFSTGFPAATLGTVEEEPEPNAHLLKEAGLAREQPKRGGSSMLISDSVRLENALTADMLRAVPMAVNEEVTMDELENEDKLERLRTAVVVKTYSKLVHLYKLKPSVETEARMLKRVKAFSRALFKNMSWNGEHASREVVTLEDFEHFFEPTLQGREEAARAFSLFDWDNTGMVDREQTTRAVMAIFNQRASVASALEDTDSIVESLESGFAGGMHFLFIAFYLHIWGINLVAGFTTFSAVMVGLSFVFGNSIRIMFEALLFLFNEHPYDVGDMVAINDLVYEVKKVRLLYTVMVDANGHMNYFSSKELLEKRIINWSRSRNHTEYMFPEVDVGAAAAVKTELRTRMNEHMKEYRSEYEPPAVVIMKQMTPNNLKVAMMISYTINFSPDQWERLCAARDSMMQIVSDVLARYQQSGELECTAAHIRVKQM